MKMLVIRRVLNNKNWIANIRTLSTERPLVDLTVDNDGVAILTLQRPPVNCLNLEMLKEISKTLDDVERSKSNAMILTSALPTVFSAGLDLMEIYKPDIKRVKEFWSTLQDVWVKLYGSSFITAAAINGHAPGGGCLLAMCCEHRVMTSGKFTIGPSETAVGLVAPMWFMDTIKNTIPIRYAEYAFVSGQLFTVLEALKVGLIDEIATDKSDAIVKCKKFIGKFDKIEPLARSVTKQKMRQTAIMSAQERRQADADEFVEWIRNPKTQDGLETYLKNLKKKA